MTFVRDIANLGCRSSAPYFSPKKELNNEVIVEIQTTGGTPKAGVILVVIQTTAVQENQRVTTVNHG